MIPVWKLGLNYKTIIIIKIKKDTDYENITKHFSIGSSRVQSMNNVTTDYI